MLLFIFFLFDTDKSLLFCCQLIPCKWYCKGNLEILSSSGTLKLEKGKCYNFISSVFQHFDCGNKFPLSNCVWILNFVVFRLLHYSRSLFIFSINHKCYLSFFTVLRQAFQVYLCYYFIIFWTRYIFWKIINSIYDCCIIYLPLKENNWLKEQFKCPQNSQKLPHISEHIHVPKLIKNC